MRRRRHTLQVSTFPFLAVLLCAMGSLILLLLVIDRRAKVVALAKARQVAARKLSEVAEVAAAREAEWQLRRLALHAQLERQNDEVRGQVESVEAEVRTAVTGSETERGRLLDLQRRLHEERDRVEKTLLSMAARQSRLEGSAKESAASRNEVDRLTAELEQLEQTLAALKATRRRQQETYSVIPYRGRQGENRRPLYVECSAQGLIFHPDGQALDLAATSPADVRAAVEKRIAKLGEQPAPEGGKADKNAYLLMLVRPDGITSYYAAMRALTGAAVEFGYEFIEQSWVLHFPDSDSPQTPQPWQTAVVADRPPVTAQPAKLPAGPRRMGVVASREPSSEEAAPKGGPGPPLPGGASSLPRTAGGADHGGPVGNAVVAPLLRMEPFQAGQGPAAAGGSGPGSPGGGGRKPTEVRGPSAPTAQGPAQAPPERMPSGVSGTPTGGAESKPSQTPANPTNARPTKAERTEQTDSGDAVSRLAPRPEEKPIRSPQAFPRLSGSRDWTITVECTAEEAILQPTRLRVPTSALAAGTPGENPLLKAVHELVTRRQALVRAGEAPYRAHLRFLVRPDGLRAYYLAYPALEVLRLPMSRENVETEEASRPANPAP